MKVRGLRPAHGLCSYTHGRLVSMPLSRASGGGVLALAGRPCRRRRLLDVRRPLSAGGLRGVVSVHIAPFAAAVCDPGGVGDGGGLLFSAGLAFASFPLVARSRAAACRGVLRKYWSFCAKRGRAEFLVTWPDAPQWRAQVCARFWFSV